MTTEESVEIFRRLKMGEQGQWRHSEACKWYDAESKVLAGNLIEGDIEVRIKPSPPKPKTVLVKGKVFNGKWEIKSFRDDTEWNREHFIPQGYRVFVEQIEEAK